jgi:hypothetical protein
MPPGQHAGKRLLTQYSGLLRGDLKVETYIQKYILNLPYLPPRFNLYKIPRQISTNWYCILCGHKQETGCSDSDTQPHDAGWCL